MFRGSTKLTLDDKGRMAIPVKYRASINESDGGRLVATLSPLDHCLWMYPLSAWMQLEHDIDRLPSANGYSQSVKRRLIGNANEMDMDKSGRILMPQALRALIGLEKQIVLSGLGRKFEIWNDSEWEAQYTQTINPSASDAPLPPELEQLAF